MRLLPGGSNLIFNDPSVTQGVQDLNVLDLFHYECHNNNHTMRYAILANTLSYIINVLHLSIMNYALSIMNYLFPFTIGSSMQNVVPLPSSDSFTYILPS